MGTLLCTPTSRSIMTMEEAKYSQKSSFRSNRKKSIGSWPSCGATISSDINQSSDPTVWVNA